MKNIKMNGMKVICTNIDGREILVNIELAPMQNWSEAAIVSITTENVDKKLFIDTLELPSTYNGIPITRITSISNEESIRSNMLEIRYVPIQNLVLPDSIKTVGDDAFAHTAIYNVRWSSNCNVIPERAFYCSRLCRLTNTKNVKYIYKGAFKNCKDLKLIESEKMVNCIKIEEDAFMGDESLTEFTWPNKCDVVPSFCFCGCKNLRVLYNLCKIERIGTSAFSESGLKTFVLGENCIHLGDACFQRCDELEDFTFNENCDVISDMCFFGCNKLSDIKNINHISKIGDYAFSQCKNLHSFNWPKNCHVIPSKCFQDSELRIINISPSSVMLSINENAFNGTKITELDLSNSIMAEIDKTGLPEGVSIKYPYYM